MQEVVRGMVTYNRKVRSLGNLLWGGAGGVPEQDRTTQSHPCSPCPWEASSGLEEQRVQWGAHSSPALQPPPFVPSAKCTIPIAEPQPPSSHNPIPAIYPSAGFLCWSAPYRTLKTALFPNSCSKPTRAPHMREKKGKKENKWKKWAPKSPQADAMSQGL